MEANSDTSKSNPPDQDILTLEKQDLSLKDILKNLFITSLPHAALIVVFLCYAMIGAAIIKEIESEYQSNLNKPWVLKN